MANFLISSREEVRGEGRDVELYKLFSQIFIYLSSDFQFYEGGGVRVKCIDRFEVRI